MCVCVCVCERERERERVSVVYFSSHGSNRVCYRPRNIFSFNLHVLTFRSSCFLSYVGIQYGGETVPYLPKHFQPCLWSPSRELLVFVFCVSFIHLYKYWMTCKSGFSLQLQQGSMIILLLLLTEE